MDSEFHKVYARWDETLWVGVNWLAKREQLTGEREYTTLNVNRIVDLCLTLADGRVLCDFGPQHDHEAEA